MRIDIATLFPEMCETVLNESIIGRARRAGKIELHTVNIRDYSDDKFHRVDDTPYGGGMGMLMEAEPLARCVEDIAASQPVRPRVIYMSPKGQTFTQQKAVELSKLPSIILVCGHYEGVDERFIEECVDEEISIGDYVLTGGELAALVIADAVGRLCDGVLSDASCYEEESHYSGLLEYPQYTRPPVWRGRAVPDVLLSGHHANIAAWRRGQSLIITRERRGDLYEKVELTKQDRKFLARYESEHGQTDGTEPDKMHE